MKPLVLRSHAVNALLPEFLKHFFLNLLALAALTAITYLVLPLFNIDFNFNLITIGIIITIILSILFISKRIISIMFTTFTFHQSYIEKKFQFFIEDSHSVSYDKITDVIIKKNLWDRICGVGDVLLKTANDTTSGSAESFLVVRDVKNPDDLKQGILLKIQNFNAHAHQNSNKNHPLR